MARPIPARRMLLRWTGWFLFGNVWLIVAVLLRNLSVVGPANGMLAQLFRWLMFAGHSAFLAFLPALLLLPLALIWPRRRLQTGLAMGLSSILLFAALVDTVIFQQYRFHLNAEIFNLVFGGAASEILVFGWTMYLQSSLLVLAIVAIQYFWARWIWRRLESGGGLRRGRSLAAALVMIFIAQGLLHAWANASATTVITRQARTLPGYLQITADKQFKRLGVESRASDLRVGDIQRGSALNYPRAELNCHTSEPPLNLVIIVIDGWRADALTPRATPNLMRLAEQSQRYDDHVAGGSATRTGLFSLFYSLPGTYGHAMLAEGRGPVLIDELLRQQYQIEIFASAKLVSPEFHRTIFARVPELRVKSKGDSASERDIDAQQDFLEFLDRRDSGRPFFSMLFYDAPHALDLPSGAPRPFQPSWDSVNYLALDNDSDPLPFRNLYLNSVHFNDALIGEALEAMKLRGLDENTVVLVTGDHGQEFNDNGLNYWGHNSNFSPPQVNVPLLLHWPGQGAASFDHRTSHFDVAPTLLNDLLGCTTEPENYGIGFPLTHSGGREWLLLANYSEYALVSRERIIAFLPYGVEVLDPTYEAVDEAPDLAAMLAAMELRGRFFR
ncbi:MAG: DUF3413 domain-containing protein [Candidatus Binatia bacterium]|nr:DUF3413 domain-containing protein [Candidatus Binatia bacterium]